MTECDHNWAQYLNMLIVSYKGKFSQNRLTKLKKLLALILTSVSSKLILQYHRLHCA